MSNGRGIQLRGLAVLAEALVAVNAAEPDAGQVWGNRLDPIQPMQHLHQFPTGRLLRRGCRDRPSDDPALMPALALPPTSAYPSDPTVLEREKLDALYLELRGNYKSLMISRGIHRSRSQRQGEQLQELGTRLRDLAMREASVRAEAYAMLEIVTDVVEHLEDSGDELSNAFGQYQLGRRSYNGGGGIARLVQAVIRFLNRWRQGKQRFRDLSARHEALRDALDGNTPESQPPQSNARDNNRSEAKAEEPSNPQSNELPPSEQPQAEQPKGGEGQPTQEPGDG